MGANAVTTFPTYTTGQVLEAADLNITNCGVPTFADTTARDGAFGGTGEKTLAEGQLCYLEDSNIVQYYDGSSWATVGPSTPGGLVTVKAKTTFSAASSVTADNVFTSAYDTYFVIIRYITSSTGLLSVKLRVGGVSASTNYNYQLLYAGAGTVGAIRSTSQTSFAVGGDTNGTFQSMVLLEINQPAIATPTLFDTRNNRNTVNYTSVQANYWVGNHSDATAYDGIELLTASGTTTGDYTIYGYAL
jgi:hypothetical protein